MNIPGSVYDWLEWLVYADFLEEVGRSTEAGNWRDPAKCLPRDYGNGYGYGYGNGNGYGDGYGYGNGYGNGYGYGDGDNNPIHQTGEPMKIGTQVLVWCGNGFAWCGTVQERTGPYEYLLTNASMVCRTGGVPWLELAHGEGRDQATFQKAHKPVGIGPQIHGWTEWEGDLP